MKNSSIQFILLFTLLTLSVKAQRNCASDVDIEQMRLNYPDQYQRILDFNRAAEDYKNSLATCMYDVLITSQGQAVSKRLMIQH